MQLIKKPFYYNSQKLNSLSHLKILNYQYYSKFILCYQKIESLGIKNIIKLKKFKLKRKKFKKKIRIKIEKILSEIYLDTGISIEYLEDDFLYKNKTQYSLGFSYNFYEKYFSNAKILNHDFTEKYFKFNKQKNYLTHFYKNLKLLSIKNKYKLIIPLKPKKGGFVSFGFGFLGFLNKSSLRYLTKSQFYYKIVKSWYLLTTLVFSHSKLKLFFKKKKSKQIKSKKIKKHLKFHFLNKKKLESIDVTTPPPVVIKPKKPKIKLHNHYNKILPIFNKHFNKKKKVEITKPIPVIVQPKQKKPFFKKKKKKANNKEKNI